jgi:hypothetical protein
VDSGATKAEETGLILNKKKLVLRFLHLIRVHLYILRDVGPSPDEDGHDVVALAPRSAIQLCCEAGPTHPIHLGHVPGMAPVSVVINADGLVGLLVPSTAVRAESQRAGTYLKPTAARAAGDGRRS